MATHSVSSWSAPRWLYPVSICWGALVPVLLFIILRLSSGGALGIRDLHDLLAIRWVLGIATVTGVYSAVFFWPVTHRARKSRVLLWAYPLATFLFVGAVVGAWSLYCLVQYAAHPADVDVGLALSLGIALTMVISPSLVLPSVLSGLVFYCLGRRDSLRAPLL